MVFGVVLVVGALPATVWTRAGSLVTAGAGRLVQERRFPVRPSALGVWAAPVMGMAFAFAWTPCIGPVLGAVLGLAATRLDPGRWRRPADRLLARPRRPLPAHRAGLRPAHLSLRPGPPQLWLVHLIGGAVLVAFGVLLVTDQLDWMASEVSNVMRDVGLGRLTTS